MRLPRTAHAAWLVLFLHPCLWAAPAPVPQRDRASEKFTVAMGLVQRQLWDEAAQSLREFVKDEPRHPKATEAWYRLGTCLLELKQTEAAIPALQSALEKADGFKLRAECRYRLGHAHMEQKQLREAVQQFQTLRQEEEAGHYLTAAAAFAEGECQRDLKQIDPALQAFRAAAQADKDAAGPYAFPALYQAGFLLLGQNRHAEAQEAFSIAADRFPKQEAAGECRYLEGQAALQAKKLEDAERAFRAASTAGGEFADDAAMGVAWVKLEAQDRKAALTAFRKVTTDFDGSPLVPRARLEICRILFRDGKHDGALKELRPLLGKEGLPPEVRLPALELAALSALEQKQLDDARNWFTEALASKPEPATAARLGHGLAETLVEQGDQEAALLAWAAVPRAAADAPLLGDILYGETLALHRLGRFDASLKRAHELLAKLPEHRLAVHARFAVAENLFALKRYADAEAAYGKVGAGEFGERADFKRAWCAFLQDRCADAAKGFTALEGAQDKALAEEAVAMSALARLQAGDDDAALQTADRYRARYPKGSHLARTERVASRVLKKKGDLTAAAARLKTAAAAEPASDQKGEDQLEQAALLFQKGDFAGARALLQGLGEANDARGARTLLGLAWCAFELGDDEMCQRHIDAGLQHPAARDSRASLLELATALHHRRSRWTEAIAAAQKFLAEFAEQPRAREVRFGLGVAQARAGQTQEARATLSALTEKPPEGRADRVFYELAWACQKTGDKEAANAAFQKVVETTKDQDLRGEADLHLGIAMLERKEVDAARTRLQGVQGKHRAQALYRLGFSWLDQKEPAKAFPCFDEIARADAQEPLRQESLFLAGECQFLADQFAPAAQRLRAFLAEAPEHERGQAARLHLGRCEVTLGRPEQAVALLEEFARRTGDSKEDAARRDLAFAHLWLGKARLARKEHERAEAALQKVTDLSDGEWAAEAQYLLGDSRVSRGDRAGGADAFVKLSILYTHADWVSKGLLAAGRCYEELEQPQKAKVFYQELLKRFGSSSAAEEARQRLKTL